jgi:hypothetical protein
MQIDYKVTYNDGREVEVTAKPKDMVAFERQYGLPFHESNRFEHICYLAWSPLHRSGQDPRAFDEFMDDLDDVEEVEGEPAVPFVPAPSDDSSAASPS